MIAARPISKRQTFTAVPRVDVDALDKRTTEHLFSGTTPIIVEGLQRGWPDDVATGQIRDVALLNVAPESIFINGKQVFDVDTAAFIESVENNENVRVFGARMVPRLNDVLRTPRHLFERLEHMDLWRNGNDKPIAFIGAGGAVTPLHYDHEENENWHIVLAGERTVFLWTDDQSARLLKLPFIGLSFGLFMGPLFTTRLARGMRADLRTGDLLFMPRRCWHQVEYPKPSMAVTFSFHKTKTEQVEGRDRGDFWEGYMSYLQGIALGRRKQLIYLPVVLPLLVFGTVYVPARLALSAIPGQVGRWCAAPLVALERLLYRAYLPFFQFAKRKFWVGY